MDHPLCQGSRNLNLMAYVILELDVAVAVGCQFVGSVRPGQFSRRGPLSGVRSPTTDIAQNESVRLSAGFQATGQGHRTRPSRSWR